LRQTTTRSLPCMEQLSLSNQYTRLIHFIEVKTTGRYWLWKLVLFCALLSWCLAVPPYTVSALSDAWAFIKVQSEDLLHPTHLEVYIRRENMVMRWVLPAVYYLTRSVTMILIIQALMGVGFLYLFSREVFRQTNDKVLTTFFALGLSNIFVFSWFFVDVAGYGDGYAYFFLMLALLTRNPFLLFVCLQAAFFTDERALVASGYLILWWMTDFLLNKPKNENATDFLTVLRGIFTPRTWVVLLALGVYVIFRSYIMRTYFPGHSYTTMGTPVLFADMHRWGLGSSLWFSFEGMWLPLGVAGYALCATGRIWHFLALLAGFVVLIITGIFVHDIDRALGYGFPLLLSSSLILSRLIPPADYRKLACVVAFFCIISPLCYTQGYNKIIWAEPLPMKAMMYIDTKANWGWFD
jgi:hypothetical protein